MTKNKRKSRKQRRLLLTSLMLALIIVIGGTFAWFTSKDEVTNQLTAKGNFGVDIWEKFTPTETWSEGETIDKDVKLVNTGSNDAFARVTLTSANTTLKKYDTSNAVGSGTIPTGAVKITLVDERTAMQAGGKLIYAAGTLTNEDVESSTYKPTTTGLYIFSRTTSTESTNNSTGEYAGYYVVKGDNTADTYYRISGITATKGNSGEVTGYTANFVCETEVTNMTFTWDYTEAANNNDTITLTYGSGDDMIEITIGLVAGWESNFQLVNNGTTEKPEYVFYYKKVLEAGKTSDQLVDSVKLTKFPSTKYSQLDFDLNVIADAVQVIYSDNSDGAATTALLKYDAAISAWKMKGQGSEKKADSITWQSSN